MISLKGSVLLVHLNGKIPAFNERFGFLMFFLE